MIVTVQNTKLMPGYKQTDVGIIPEGWEIAKLGEIADIKTGPFGSALHEKDYVDDGTPIITVEHLSEQGVIYVNLPMVSDLDKKRLKAYILLKGDIVFSRVGSVDRNSLIKEEESGWLFSGRLLRIRLKTLDICSALLSYYLNQEPTKQRIRAVAVGQTMPSLNTQILRSIDIAFPPTTPEQRAIATVLSDIDALIASLDKLIAKKRDIKQATMQQLLTGKTRLSGFSGEWGEKKLGEVIEFTNGKPYEKFVRDDGRYFLITLDSISIDGKIKKEHKRVDFFDGSLCKNDIIIILDDVAHGNFLGLCDLIPEDNKYILNQRVGRLKTIATISPKFLSLLINYNQDHFKKRGQGTSQKHIYKRDIEELSILIPEFAEQTAIATVLSDMDAEIAALEQKRDKTRALKQGMMQELLTGKTRLVTL